MQERMGCSSRLVAGMTAMERYGNARGNGVGAFGVVGYMGKGNAGKGRNQPDGHATEMREKLAERDGCIGGARG